MSIENWLLVIGRGANGSGLYVGHIGGRESSMGWMARPLRILLAGGWYHVSSRGNRREALFVNDADRRRFLGLVTQLPERFEVHAFVLMDTFYTGRADAGDLVSKGTEVCQSVLRRRTCRQRSKMIGPMKLRLDLVEHLTANDFMEEVLANNHRYKPEPLLSKTGAGSLSPASTEERAHEEARNTASIQRLIQRSHESGTSKEGGVAPSAKRSNS